MMAMDFYYVGQTKTEALKGWPALTFDKAFVNVTQSDPDALELLNIYKFVLTVTEDALVQVYPESI